MIQALDSSPVFTYSGQIPEPVSDESTVICALSEITNEFFLYSLRRILLQIATVETPKELNLSSVRSRCMIYLRK